MLHAEKISFMHAYAPSGSSPIHPHTYLMVAVPGVPSSQPLHADLDAKDLLGHLIDDALHPCPQGGPLAVVVEYQGCRRDLRERAHAWFVNAAQRDPFTQADEYEPQEKPPQPRNPISLVALC